MVKQAPIKGRTAVKVHFVLPKNTVAGNVSVVGDFNGWDPFAAPAAAAPQRHPQRGADPAARAPVAFRYLAEGGRWHDDDTAGVFEPNGIGGYNAVINT